MLLTENDPTKLELAAFDKDGNQVAISTMGKSDVSVTGLPDGETVADGTYKVAFTDGANVGPKVDTPGIVISKASGSSSTGTTSATGTGSSSNSSDQTGTATVGSGTVA